MKRYAAEPGRKTGFPGSSARFLVCFVGVDVHCANVRRRNGIIAGFDHLDQFTFLFVVALNVSGIVQRLAGRETRKTGLTC